MRTFVTLLLPAVLFLAACAPPATAQPTPSPAASSTLTALPTHTLTPEPTPTPRFYASDIIISATAESCAVPPLKTKMCISGLGVKFTGRKLDKYTVTVTAPGIPESSFDCPVKFRLETFGPYSAPVDCDSTGITFVSVGLEQFTLTVSWEGGSTTQTFTPVYEADAVNGPQCAPVCSVANVEMNIP